MGVASAESTGCTSNAALRESVDGSASSRLKSRADALGADDVRNSTRNLCARNWGDSTSPVRYAERPALRSSMSVSSSHAEGTKVVARIRLGGREPGSLRVSCSATNYVHRVEVSGVQMCNEKRV